MAQKAQKVVAISVQLADRPGLAAEIANLLRERGISLKAVWAWAESGTATFVCVPEEVGRLRALAAQEGVAVQEKPLIWLEGVDETGALCNFLNRVASAGINISKMMAIGAGGTFGALFGFADEATVDRVLTLVGGA